MNNKLIIFDLDGVLVNTKDLHFHALNNALLNVVGEKFVITKQQHLSMFDGLPTSKKLELLHVQRHLSSSYFGKIWAEKQKQTLALLDANISYSKTLVDMFANIKLNGINIGIASNSITQSLEHILNKLGVKQYCDVIVSNEDVKYPKPYPEMYWQCMIATKTLPKNTVIYEDSAVGRQGAIDSGAHLIPIKDCDDLTEEKIREGFIYLNKRKNNIKWKDKHMNILIPMAGAGSRFENAGYTFPKPLIEVFGKPMIQAVVENINIEARYIYIVQAEHYKKYNLQFVLELITPGCEIIAVDNITQGAACTTLLASEFINNNDPLIIANCDQIIQWNSNEVLYEFTNSNIDGGILTFESTHPKWSYVKINEFDGFADQVAEKKPISNNATVGIYYWKHGSDYVKYANQMIDKNIRVNNEFYVAPVFNEAIQDKKKFRIKNVEKMWGIGTPEDLQTYLRENQ